MGEPPMLQRNPDFSLVLGGPLYQLFRRTRLSGDALELVRRRVILLAAIAWLPLLVLSVASGLALGDTVAIPFLHDIEAHVRFLVGLPLLIAAELIVHQRLRVVVQQFVARGIVTPAELPKFHAAIESTQRLRNSVLVEIALIVFVFTVGQWIWRNQVALGGASWYATPDGTQLHLTPAGIWYVFISLPIFQFILLRWVYRYFLWFYFLLRVARLRLHLLPIHTDRAGGLGFLGVSAHAFAPILLAQGAVLAGLFASQIFHAGHSLTEYRVHIVGFLSLFVLIVFIPLTVFMPNLARAKREGIGAFGRLASRYCGRFERKWLRDDADDDALLGSADLQSLADLGNANAIVQEMRIVPFGWRDVTQLAAVAFAPFLPLLLTVFSLQDVAKYVLQLVF